VESRLLSPMPLTTSSTSLQPGYTAPRPAWGLLGSSHHAHHFPSLPGFSNVIESAWRAPREIPLENVSSSNRYPPAQLFSGSASSAWAGVTRKAVKSAFRPFSRQVGMPEQRRIADQARNVRDIEAAHSLLALHKTEKRPALPAHSTSTMTITRSGASARLGGTQEDNLSSMRTNSSAAKKRHRTEQENEE
jgi:hypothetical protein